MSRLPLFVIVMWVKEEISNWASFNWIEFVLVFWRKLHYEQQ